MLKSLLDMHPQPPELRRKIRKLSIGQLLPPEHQDGAIDKCRLNDGDFRPDIAAR
jgi:hypothetical protein